MGIRRDDLADGLRQEVRRLKTLAGRTRAVPTLVNVGRPGGRRVVLPTDAVRTGRAEADAALRADALTRALDRLARPGHWTLWLTRSGPLAVGEHDLVWRSAAVTTLSRHGVDDPDELTCFVVTRHGWLDLRTERSCSWPRLRPGSLAEDAVLRPERDEDGVWPVVG